MKTENKLIDKFMGIDFDVFHSVTDWEPNRYHESWNHLMPVIERMRPLWKKGQDGMAAELMASLFDGNINSVHSVVVLFIKQLP